MTLLTDEKLMAYADGELSLAERRLVEESLARDPAASRRLEIFAGTRGLLRTALGGATEPIPERLLDTVLGAASATAPAPQRNMPDIARPSWLSQLRTALFTLTPAHAVGAAAAVLVAGLFGQVGTPSTDPSALLVSSSGRVLAHGALQRVLEGSSSGTSVAFGMGADAGELKPVMTFKRQDGQPCRIYELDHNSGTRANGVGCRAANGQWVLEVHSGVTAAKRKPGQIVPASGAVSPVVEAAVDKMIAGDALGADDEAKLMKNRWQN